METLEPAEAVHLSRNAYDESCLDVEWCVECLHDACAEIFSGIHCLVIGVQGPGAGFAWLWASSAGATEACRVKAFGMRLFVRGSLAMLFCPKQVPAHLALPVMRSILDTVPNLSHIFTLSHLAQSTYLSVEEPLGYHSLRTIVTPHPSQCSPRLQPMLPFLETPNVLSGLEAATMQLAIVRKMPAQAVVCIVSENRYDNECILLYGQVLAPAVDDREWFEGVRRNTGLLDSARRRTGMHNVTEDDHLYI